MVIPSDIENALNSVEGLIHEISEALVAGDSQALALASVNLRQGAVEFCQKISQLSVDALKDPSLKLRLKRISVNLAARRESLIRQSGVVERSLNTLVPASRTTTYAKTAGPYGGAGKPSGTFNYVAM